MEIFLASVGATALIGGFSFLVFKIVGFVQWGERFVADTEYNIGNLKERTYTLKKRLDKLAGTSE